MVQRPVDSKTQIRAFFVRSWQLIVISFAVLGLLLLVIAWSIALDKEQKGLHRRHICSIIGFSFALVSIISDGITIKAPPNAIHLYLNELVAIVSLVLNALSIGMNNVVVDLCFNDQNVVQATTLHCKAHYLEFFGGLLVCGCMVSILMCTNHKIQVLVDRGILKGIGLRLSNI